MNKVNLAEKLPLFDTHWDPKIVAACNDNDVILVKFQGAFPFHKNATTDDAFRVIDGSVRMDYDGAESVTFGPGERLVVPRGEPNSGDSDRPAAAKTPI